jgi:HEAT repeat protein
MKMWLRVSAGISLAAVFVLSAIHFRGAPDPQIRGRSASAWAAGLLSPDYTVRGEAQNAFKQLGESSVPQLCVLVRKRNPPWEKHIVRLNTILPFLNYQRVDAVACRLRGAEMLGLLGPVASHAIPDLIDALAFDPDEREPERALVQIGSKSIQPLSRALTGSSDAKIRQRAARLLREFGSLEDSAIAALTRATRDQVASVREEAALSLGAPARQRNEISKCLVPLASDPAENVRAAAFKALGQIAVPENEVLAALQRGLADRTVPVRLAAAKSLWALRRDARATVPVLTEILLGHERRWEAAYALGEIGPEAAPAVPALIKALTMEQVARPFRTPPSSAFALGKIGPSAIPALSELLTNRDSRVRTSALLAFSFMGKGGAEAVPRVLEKLHDRDVEVRHTAALTLPAIGAHHEPVVLGLADCLRDDDIYVRSAAAAVLRRIAPDRTWVVQPE